MRTNTIPRPPSLDQLDPPAAAYAIGKYLGYPLAAGDWQISPFIVDDKAAEVDYLRSFGDGGGRYTPAGDYLSLYRSERGVVMSNTPDEIADHQPAFDQAKGRVLVHGLGLSCVVSGLLAKRAVKHIDVVELDESVIEMVGPAFDNEDRVTIHAGDCMTYDWPTNARWDFAWHDIWTHLSSDNLRADDAENGIGYDSLFRRFADRVDRQGAWALDHALLMDECYRMADAEAESWNARWIAGDEEARVNLQLEWLTKPSEVVTAFMGQESTLQPEAMRRLLEGSGMADDLLEKAKRPEVKFFVDAPPLIPKAKPKLAELRTNYLRSLDLTGVV